MEILLSLSTGANFFFFFLLLSKIVILEYYPFQLEVSFDRNLRKREKNVGDCRCVAVIILFSRTHQRRRFAGYRKKKENKNNPNPIPIITEELA